MPTPVGMAPRPALLRTLALAALLLAGHTPAALAARIVAAGVAAADGRMLATAKTSPDRPPLTAFSPDGDGVADAAWFSVVGDPGTAVRLVALWRFQGERGVWSSGPVELDADGHALVTWDGHAGRRQPPVITDEGRRVVADGSYTVVVCPVDDRCPVERAGSTAVALVRRLAVGIASARAFAPGDRVPLLVRSEERRLVAELHAEPYVPGAEPLDAAELDPTAAAYALPDVPAGLYRLVITDDEGNQRALPLPVRDRAPLAAPRPGTVLVVLPYLTWRSYNQWDDDADGRPDTWYAAAEEGTEDGSPWRVTFAGPYVADAAIQAGSERDQRNAWPLGPLLRRHPGRFQVVTDVVLAAVPEATIDAYAGVLLPGHTEYYPNRLYDLLVGYRDRGGRIAQLSANGFYRVVHADRRADVVEAEPEIVRTPARGDRALLGAGYITCCFAGRPPYRVTAAGLRAVPWLFRGTGLRAGDAFGAAGIEVDGVGATTPPETVVVAGATVAGAAGPKRTTVTFLPAPRGGGVLNLANVFFLRSTVERSVPAARRLAAARMLENTWAWLAAGRPPGAAG